MLKTPRLLSYVLLGAWALSSCAEYAPRPLDLAADLAAWRTLDPSDEAVGELARRLEAVDANQPDPNAAEGMTLARAEAVALDFNPQLRSARLAARVPLAGATEAGRWDDPEFELDALRILENVDHRWIVAGGLSLTIPVSGRLAVEKDKAWAEYSAAWREVAVAEWELLGKLRAAWRDWSAQRRRVALLQEYLVGLKAIGQTAAKLAAAGELRPADARVFRIEQATRETELAERRASVEQKRRDVLSLLGLSPETPLPLEPAPAAPHLDLPAGERPVAICRNHPKLNLARAEYEVAEQALRKEIRKQYPDITIGGLYENEEGQSRIGLGLGIPIPVLNRNQRGIAEATAARDAARARAQAALSEVMAHLAEVEGRLASARRGGKALREQVAPLVRQQIDEIRKLAELGEVDALLIQDALARSLETNLAILEAQSAEALAAEELAAMLRPRWVAQEEQRTTK